MSTVLPRNVLFRDYSHAFPLPLQFNPASVNEDREPVNVPMTIDYVTRRCSNDLLKCQDGEDDSFSKRLPGDQFALDSPRLLLVNLEIMPARRFATFCLTVVLIERARWF
jgi:hypothetical protein